MPESEAFYRPPTSPQWRTQDSTLSIVVNHQTFTYRARSTWRIKSFPLFIWCCQLHQAALLWLILDIRQKQLHEVYVSNNKKEVFIYDVQAMQALDEPETKTKLLSHLLHVLQYGHSKTVRA